MSYITKTYLETQFKNFAEKIKSLLNNKVDKIEGKGLSTNDLTSELKSNYDTAYDHSQSAHARTDATKVESSTTNGNIKINGTETTVYTHPSGTNPHGTTKSDVGLGNVPNVATNDQTPSYTEATSLTKLTSGEKLSVAFGKISKAVTDLISHIGDSVKHITSTERTNWDSAKTHADSAHAPSNAQANVIETVKVNGTSLTPTSKSVNITVPTNNNQLTNGAGYTTNKGTITGIKMNGASKGTSGVVDLGTVLTEHQDISGKSNVGHKHTKSEITDFPTSMTPTAHNQASNTINAMTGYSKPASTSAISTSDTLNTAIGKLEKALESKGSSNFSGSYNDLTNKPTIPSNTNQLTNGAGYITSSGTAKTISDTLPISKGGTGQTSGVNAANALINSLPEWTATPVDDGYFISQDISLSNVYGRRKTSTLWDYIKSKLATVATSGSYNDLSNKPTIPSVGNGTVTIKQAGTSKGTFTMNQTGNTTIELTDNNTVYTHPTTSGNKHIPSGGSSGQILRWSSDGTAVWGNDNNTTYGAAGASLGLIKSGGDLTITDGVAQVNDDSHNHVISNVDGLQSALDGKAASSHTHDDRYYTEAEIDNTLNSISGTIFNNNISKKNFTYVVYNPDTLRDWIENKSGNDYTSVLIKKGTYSYTITDINNFISVSKQRTLYIEGEEGSSLNITYNATVNSNYFFIIGGNIKLEYAVSTTDCMSINNVDINLFISGLENSTEYYVGILKYANGISNCKFMVKAYECKQVTLSCYYGSTNLNNCIGDTNVEYPEQKFTPKTGYVRLRPYYSCSRVINCYAYGKSGYAGGAFYNGDHIINCNAKFEDMYYGETFNGVSHVIGCRSYASVGTENGGSACAYKNCKKMLYNYAAAGSYSGSYASADTNSTYLCANTLNGGWNS